MGCSPRECKGMGQERNHQPYGLSYPIQTLADLIVFARALQGVTAGSLPGPDAGAPKSRVGVLKVKKVIGKEYIEFITGKEI